MVRLALGCLMPLSTIFQLYRWRSQTSGWSLTEQVITVKVEIILWGKFSPSLLSTKIIPKRKVFNLYRQLEYT
jgi:hypothetical protein